MVPGGIAAMAFAPRMAGKFSVPMALRGAGREGGGDAAWHICGYRWRCRRSGRSRVVRLGPDGISRDKGQLQCACETSVATSVPAALMVAALTIARFPERALQPTSGALS